MQAGALGHPFPEETLLDAGLAKAFRSIDRVAPEDADDVIGLEGGLDVFGIGLAGGDGICGRFPTANVLVAILEADGEVADKNGLAGELVNFVELFLWEFAMERWLDRDAVHVGKHFLQHVGVQRIEAEAVSEDEVVGGMFSLGFTNNAKVLAGDEAKEGLVAGLAVITLPSAEKLSVYPSTGGVIRQATDEVDPVPAK